MNGFRYVGEDEAGDGRIGLRRPQLGALHAIHAHWSTSNDVATVAMGLAASMGQFLLSAGTPGKRFALPHSRIMMHQPSGGLGGTASDIRIQAEQSLHIKRTMAGLIAEHTGQTVEQIEADSDRDRWFTAEQALEYGFIDHVYERASQIKSEAPNQ